MQRPIIFVATADTEFESIALDAVLTSHHGMRVVRDLGAARARLSSGTNDIALAVIDLDLHREVLTLSGILGGCEPDCPILAVSSAGIELNAGDLIGGVALDCLCKPVAVDELLQSIQALCSRDSGRAHIGRHDLLVR